MTLVGPGEGFADDPLEYLATGGFDLDGATQTEVTNGEATVEEAYAWSYAPALCDGLWADGPEETFRFAPEHAPGEYTVMVTYTVTLRYRDGTSDQDWASDSIQVTILISGLCVLIIEPEADPFVVLAGEEQEFEAVALLDGVELDSEHVTWSWSFGDNTALGTDNPTVHTYQECGAYTVTVTATYLGLQAQAVVLAQANPQEATDFEFFAWSFGRVDDGGEICDQTELVVRTAAGHQFTARFYGRLPNGEWSQFPPLDWGAFYFNEEEDGVQYQAASPNTLPTHDGKNGPGQWRAEVMIEQGAEDPPIVANLYLTLTANNTVVKDRTGGTGVILHDPEEPTHTISWNITHKDLEGDAPKFSVDVEIYALTGGEPLIALHNTNVSLHGGHCTWDGKIPGEGGMKDAAKGIYTYKIIASHDALCGCDDQDKSKQLVISNVATDTWDVNLEEETVTFSVSYYLNQAATAIGVRVYDPQFRCVFAYACLPADAGARHSPQCEFPINRASLGGHYWVVLYGLESADAAQNNRDRTVKWALHKGTMEFIAPVVEAKCARDAYEGWHDWRPARVDQALAFKGFEHGFGGMPIIKREWHGGYGDWCEVQAEEPFYWWYPTTGERTATYRVTYLDDLGCERSVQDTCDVTVFQLECGDMWFLDVETPPEGYPNTTTFTATGATTGCFLWQVVNGDDKVNLENGNDSMSKDDESSVQVYATYFSGAEEDVEIEFSCRRAEGDPFAQIGSETLSVRRPVLTLLPGYPLEGNAGLLGFQTYYRFSVRDQFNRDLPGPLPVNESFGEEGSNIAGENWARGNPNGITIITLDDLITNHVIEEGDFEYAHILNDLLPLYRHTYTYVDEYSYHNGKLPPPNPVTVNPGTTYWEDDVYWRVQRYRAGSVQPGQGLLLKEHTLQMKRGCARQQ